MLFRSGWTDKTTGEHKTAKCPFMMFSKDCKEDFAKTTLKVGDVVTCEYEQVGWDKTLLKVGLKPAATGGGGFRGAPRDPVAEAKKQRMIVRQSCLDRAVSLWINGTPGVPFTQDNRDQLFAMAEDFEKWVMRE